MSGRELESLLQALRDGQRLYQTASVWADPSTAALLREIAERRGWFAAALDAVFQDRDPSPCAAAPRGGSHFALHERFAADHAELLALFEESEARLLARYRRALAHDLPGDVALVLAEQYSDVRSTHEEIRASRYEEEWVRAGETS